jgi:enoyl-CoA hydratase/carnithine racemase
MGIPEAARSLVAVGGGCFRLPKRIPYHLAVELAITGKAWPATRFAELGLINKLTEPGQALAGAVELAHESWQPGRWQCGRASRSSSTPMDGTSPTPGASR